MAETFLDSDLLAKLEQLQIATRRISTGNMRGERRSKRRGFSSDFADYRNYVSGDDTRYLDWKIYARLEKLYLKLFLEEEDLQIHVILDCSSSMNFGSPNKLNYAKRLAAAISYISLCKMDSVNVYGFAGGLDQIWGAKRGKFNAKSLFEFLDNLKVSNETALESSLNLFSQQTKGKGVVILLSDFYDFNGYEPALKNLFGRNFDVYVMHLLSPEELHPELKGDIRLVDSELGFATDISVGKKLLTSYEKTLDAFCGGLKDYVNKRGGNYSLVSTDLPFEKMVLDVLCRKGLIR